MFQGRVLPVTLKSLSKNCYKSKKITSVFPDFEKYLGILRECTGMAKHGPLQLTLALLKPDVTRVPYVLQAIRSKILSEEFLVVRHKEVRLSRQETEKFYGEHEGKFFYNRLVTFMASGPTHALVLAREDAIKHWRALMGPTKVYKTKYEAPHTLRGLYGLTDTRNSTHGSDSPETAAKEMDFFFPEFNREEWLESEGEKFRKGLITLDENNFIHRVSLENRLNNGSVK
ncbi:nucleoside diphosphate kinase 6-like isoform X1 [Penaeus chinensis]|uniref:nucleoside diphosphate kinase 6-like isoform X1 n=2 Tax=Penaeus chinensis TaxID=139456 RepID=UPI001FB83722|nr:nucleoside diphosphate kinase 6-like isoform X1 [Penaeus chinensis]